VSGARPNAELACERVNKRAGAARAI
jgi:hypothetical protein